MALLRQCLEMVRAAQGLSGPPALAKRAELTRLHAIGLQAQAEARSQGATPEPRRAMHDEDSYNGTPPAQAH